MQNVGETVEKLNESNHGVNCRGSSYKVQILEKPEGNEKSCRSALRNSGSCNPSFLWNLRLVGKS